ncbi:aminotransferase class I/II-fold pyridoxal phosphate-dependent enzyme [Cellvibrio japonicus]|uniref:Aspartate transaminase n=1 Tax=Cellvibrio japonicus (strain Ueda107) TaxID=498211 RepID=B3PL97_CELJU|nr:aminotransferase class I/II-fold pyridoxal phosphate-dependent enzyme [Cellvibrio japonicus]ACE83491.1 aspartate transaminase [Cellvibrio japonicus Ueda107]QEI11555.1 aminotransferase class I/II-fold pyridoxal phosphate-dependent enzyme [Cellvibrio japonicus]QEI15129.1 aminotransferase class I/II-fold pyridoxal phosphate-dependent enzyme [Cellvibrio japonicus]QEI18709.1 aminotransferase class I/II-fold pyridoxal phosphate-dependent enzyme [Cellvibrio japonicus]
MQLDNASLEQLREWESQLATQYQAILAQKLNLDLTRGKPSAEQLSLSDALDGILAGNYTAADGTDTRNYGGLDGLPEAKQLGANIMDVDAGNVLVGGNSSLTLMFQVMLAAYQFGLKDAASAWKHEGEVKFICPVPGYDRHYTVCEQLGIKMITVPMTSTGPDMDAVEALVKSDTSIKGMWCVPKYSNPTGVVYSDETVERIAKLGLLASANFRVFWDNAYSVHDLIDNAPKLANILEATRRHGTEDSVVQFASTSKITHAGSGVAFVAASAANLAGIKKFLNTCTIGPDKVNQIRHTRFLPSKEALTAHMTKHAALLNPRFEAVLSALSKAFDGTDLGAWEKPVGGYFVSFDTRRGCAKETVRLAAEAGVKLTPAGATYPYGKDPEDRNIRIAPSVPTVPEVIGAMEVFVTCVKLASVRNAITQQA